MQVGHDTRRRENETDELLKEKHWNNKHDLYTNLIKPKVKKSKKVVSTQ